MIEEALSYIMLRGIILLCFAVPVILTVLNVINLFRKKKIKELSVDILILLLGSLLTVFLLSCVSDYSYNESVIIGGFGSKYHQPFSEDYIIWLIVPAVLGFIGMIKLSAREVHPPLATVIYMDFIIIGMILSILYIVQISAHIADTVILFEADVIYLCLFPFNYILCGIRLIRENIVIYLEHMNKNCIVPKNSFLMKWYSILADSHKIPVVLFGFFIVIIAIIFSILVLFGQGADGFVRLFTQTADWTFSQQIPPPPVQYEGHYLCTVAAGGHEKIVKPQRIGYRQHTKIIVNRQLCIANAFEQFIEEKLPRIHKMIRFNYDRYGYPLSKHITTPLRADMVYIAMKPLEWAFLVFLYLFDINPEKRISVQYTKK